MTTALRRIAMVSMHTSPVETPGRGDAGGMNVTMLGLAGALAGLGVEVDLLTRADGLPRETELRDGVVLHSLAAGPASALPKMRLPEVADDFGEAVAALVGRRAPRFQLLHAHYWLSGLAILPVALELGLPLVQSFHTIAAMKNRLLAPGDSPEPEGRVRGEMFLANQADAIVAGSAAEVTSLIDELRAPADRIWVIPPGVDTALFTPERAARSEQVRGILNLEADRPLVVTAARIQPLKDQELAIRAFAESSMLTAQRPLLVLAGEASDRSYLDRLRAVARELEVSDDVRFVGALDRELTADLLAAATMTLVPSHSETFGLVALESAASGTPVLGYAGTGLADSIADGVSGILVDDRSPATWGAVIASLLGDPLRLAELGVSARAHAEGFTWATAATSLLAVYESLLRD